MLKKVAAVVPVRKTVLKTGNLTVEVVVRCKADLVVKVKRGKRDQKAEVHLLIE